MAPGRKGPKQPSTLDGPEVHETPVNEYEKQRLNNIMQNNRVFHGLGLEETASIMKSTRAKYTVAAGQEEPEEEVDIEQGVVDKEPELSRSLEQNVSIPVGASKRVMALHGEEQPARITRQRTRESSAVHQDCNVPTTDLQGGSTEDALLPGNMSNGGK